MKRLIKIKKENSDLRTSFVIHKREFTVLIQALTKIK